MHDLWMKNIISRFGLVDLRAKLLKIYCDNSSTIFFFKNETYILMVPSARKSITKTLRRKQIKFIFHRAHEYFAYDSKPIDKGFGRESV